MVEAWQAFSISVWQRGMGEPPFIATSLAEQAAEQVEKARHQGYVETLLGRRRYLPDILRFREVLPVLVRKRVLNADVLLIQESGLEKLTGRLKGSPAKEEA